MHQSTAVIKKTELQDLPSELIEYIFSFLSPANLVITELTTKYWKNLGKAGWKHYIEKWLAPLMNVQDDQINEDPKKVCLHEYHRLKGVMAILNYHFPIKYIFASMKGDLTNISRLLPHYQKYLYSYAIAHGHYAALDEVGDQGLTALEMAAVKNRLENVKYLLAKITVDPQDAYRVALKGSMLHGHLRVVSYLLTVDNQLAGLALMLAAKWGHRNIVDYLIDNYLVEISAESKIKALMQASNEGHFDIFKKIFKLESVNLQAVEKNLIVLNATRFGQLDILKHLLETGAEEIIGYALRSAAYKGQLEIIKYLLWNEAANIADDNIGQALCAAAKEGHLNVVTYLLEQTAADIPIDYKSQARKLAATNGYFDIAVMIAESYASPKMVQSLKVLYKIQQISLAILHNRLTWCFVGSMVGAIGIPALIAATQMPYLSGFTSIFYASLQDIGLALFLGSFMASSYVFSTQARDAVRNSLQSAFRGIKLLSQFCWSKIFDRTKNSFSPEPDIEQGLPIEANNEVKVVESPPNPSLLIGFQTLSTTTKVVGEAPEDNKGNVEEENSPTKFKATQ